MNGAGSGGISSSQNQNQTIMMHFVNNNNNNNGAGMVNNNNASGVAKSSNCLTWAIRQEIQRFESVHPNIYALYDLVDLIGDPLLAQRIREHVVCVEDSFVNSQEWTIPRTVPEIKLGIVGSPASGKSALVHRYLTGSYLQEESPEGGRFKKEVNVDGRSYLLMVRDEGGSPEPQFANWVDGVIFVFSLEDGQSYKDVYAYYNKMMAYRPAELPVILVGTQDAINESNPRMIDEEVARKLQSDMNKCPYYETCATYGLNVERVFQDACQRITAQRSCLLSAPRPATPGSRHALLHSYNSSPSPRLDGFAAAGNAHASRYTHLSGSRDPSRHNSLTNQAPSTRIPLPSPTAKPAPVTAPTTPSTMRKNRRRSNILMPKKSDCKEPEIVGVGRPIPKKQGFLYKHCKGLSGESRKKKYCVLFEGGRLVYYNTMNDYMNSSQNGKEISLYNTSVRVPGQPPTGVQRPQAPVSQQNSNGSDKNLVTAYELLTEDYPPPRTPAGSLSSTCEELFTPNGSLNGYPEGSSSAGTPQLGIKKRPRRLRGGLRSTEAQEEETGEFEFIVQSLDNRQWSFDASSLAEREEWVQAIQQEIHNGFCQRGSEPTSSGKERSGSEVERPVDKKMVMEAVRRVPGNDRCADCQAPSPKWCSLNLGVVICIDCCGVHRMLGSHVSKVRSLDLDDWTPWLVGLMESLGNRLAACVWENQLQSSHFDRTNRQEFIQQKYVHKRFLAPLSMNSPLISPLQMLIEAIDTDNLPQTLIALAHLPRPKDDLNRRPSRPSSPYPHMPLHLACQRGLPVICQLLLWKDADSSLPDEHGLIPLAYAQSSNSTECVHLLPIVPLGNGGVRSPPFKPGSFRVNGSSVDQLERLPASII